jgi:hypothetical protein
MCESMAMYLCTCGEWVSSTDNHQCKLNPFNVIMNDEDKEQNCIVKERS